MDIPFRWKKEIIKFISKKNFFLIKFFFLDKLIEENDNKNVIFLKYNGEIYALKLKITKEYYEKF